MPVCRAVPAIDLKNVVKRFGDITAVDGLDLEVPEGHLPRACSGPTGPESRRPCACSPGQAIADSGDIDVLGHELPSEAKAARAEMGVVPQLDNLDVDVTVEDNLAVFARLYRVKDVKAAVEGALDLARLQERRHDAVDKLSGGMRRRLLLARGLVHEPRLVLLDEPTVGLDPQIRTELWSLIDGLRTRGSTILMSTHYIEEAQRLADEVAVMTHGKIIARGKPDDLILEHAGRETAEVYAPPDAPGRGPRAAPRPRACACGPPARRSRSSAPRRRTDGVVPEDAVRRAASLEDVFVLLTGEEAE